MTTHTLSHLRSGPNPRAFLILGTALLSIISLAWSLLKVQPAAMPVVTWPSGHRVEYNTHAVNAHGPDALATRKCLETKGPYQTWANLKADKYYFPCQLPDGRWGTLIATKVKGVYEEITSYVKDPGTWAMFEEWMRQWGATRFTGPP